MIYVMNGSVTELNLRADHPGQLLGLSTHFSGDGFSDMHFEVEALPQEEFARWAETTSRAGKELNRTTYSDLAKQSMNLTPFVYGKLEPGLFEAIVSQKIPPGPGPVMPPIVNLSAPDKG
jgi:cytochrome o ubiquinol oxidase subunit 2